MGTKRWWLTFLCAAVLCGVATAADNVWVGGAGSAETPGDWNVVANWWQGGQPATAIPNIPNGGGNWEPIVVTGSADAPVFLSTTGVIEGYTFRLRADHANITIAHLNKLQTDTAIVLRNASTLSLGYQSGGHFVFQNVDVGDGCTLALTTPDVAGCGSDFGFTLKLNDSGLMTMNAWSLTGKTGTVSFSLPLEAETKGVKTRTLISWPSGSTNNLTLSAGTVTATASWAATAPAVTEIDLFAEGVDVSALALGAYYVKKDADGYKVAYVVGPAPEGTTRAPVTFDVPAGWGTTPVPKQVWQTSLTGNLALEQQSAARQTLGGRAANVAEITGSSGSFSFFGLNDSGHGNKDTVLERDVWLKVSGGSHALIVGGSENHWNGSKATPLRGDVFVELANGVTADNIVGAIHKSGNGVDNGAAWPTAFVGNTMLVVKGTVRGSIVGGATSAHRCTPTLTGNTTVRILSVQGTNANALPGVGNRILGASGWIGNTTGSGALQIGDAAVRVELADTASGDFVKEIAGGSYAKAESYAITGSTSVSVKAPDAVTFTLPIYGGSISDATTATVSGTASVTIDGGTYVNRIVAGGYGANGGVSGKVTLLLKGGVFTNALVPSVNNAPVGSSELVIDGGTAGIDLSQATTVGAFGAVVLRSDLVLGANRLSGTTLRVEGSQTLTLTLSEAELADRRAVVGRAAVVPEGLSVTATNVPEGAAWSLAVVDGVLYFSAGATEQTWTTPAIGSEWADGLPGFAPGDNVVFGAQTPVPTVPEPVTLANDVRVGTLTVGGSYTFSGSGTLSAERAEVSAGGALMLDMPQTVQYLRLTPSGAVGTGSNGYPGIAELILYKGSEPVAWPSGTTIVQKNADGSEVQPVWAADGNEPTPNALIDGVYAGTPNTYTNPADGSTGTYSASNVNNNKWWPREASGAAAVITLGTPVDFDGYVVWHTDHLPRSPRAWALEGSVDGTTWFNLDTRTFTEAEMPGSANVAYHGGVPFGVGLHLVTTDGITIAGLLGGRGVIRGDVVFSEGSSLKASSGLTLEGAVSGTATLDVSGLTLDDTTVLSVLRAAEGLTLVPPSGYVVSYADGCYWLARALTQPLVATLAADAAWMNAGWQDVAGIAVAPAQWSVLPPADITATVTASAESTLTLESARTIGTFGVAASSHTLTLAGAKLTASALTLAGNLSASSATLALAPAEIAADATLTYDVPAGSFTLPAMTGTGTLVKTGSGTLQLNSEVQISPEIVVKSGTLELPSENTWGTVYPNKLSIVAEDSAIVYLSGAMGSINNTESVITLRDGGIFRFINGNNWSARPIKSLFRIENNGVMSAKIQGTSNGDKAEFTGKITGFGRVVFEAGSGNAYKISAPISDDAESLRVLALRYADANTVITIAGNNTYTGGTEVASAVTASNANAFGKGDLTVESGKTLTVNSDITLNVYGILSGAGTVSGAVKLVKGAGLNATTVLTVTGAVAAEAPVTVTLPAGAVAGTCILRAGSPSAATAANLMAEGFGVAPKTTTDGVSVDGYYLVELPTVSGLPEGTDVEEIQRIAAANGLTEATVSGKSAGADLSDVQKAAALECFTGLPQLGAEPNVINVSYDFGIASVVQSAGTVTVTVKVQGANGAAAGFSEGVTLGLVRQGESSAFTTAATVNADGSAVFSVPLSDLTAPFGVRATK